MSDAHAVPNVLVRRLHLRYTVTSESVDTATAAELTTPVNQQTSATDSDLSTVTNDVTTVTDSQTQTGMSETPALICRVAGDEHTNIKHCYPVNTVCQRHL